MSVNTPTPELEGDGPSECTICFTPFDSLFHLPKILSCKHVFCLECLSRITVASTQPDALPCPICRLPTPLPKKKGPLALSNDQHLLNKMDKQCSSPTASVKFNRKRGLLYTQKTNSLHISTISHSVDLGRPTLPQRSSRNLQNILRNGGCILYSSIGAAILLTIALVLAGVYIFYLLPWKISTGMGSGNSNGTSETNTTTAFPIHR